MKKIVLYAAVISVFSAVVAQAQNENVTWLAPANISGASDVNIQGTYYGTWAPQDGNANNLPVNGVHFQAYSDLPGFNVGGFVNGYGGFNNPGTGNGNYNSLLQYASYDGSGNGSGDTLTWSDVPGHTYLIEIWANDGRGNGRTETITGGANTSASLDFGNAPGQYIIGTYVADSSGSETITFSGAASPNGNYPQVNLLLIRDITEGSVTWQTPANISKDSDVSTQGTYFGSWAPEDGGANSKPVNGVTFQGNSDLPGFSSTGYNSGYNAYPPSPSGSANYNALLAYGAYDSPGQPYATFSWTGMTPGHTYQVEIWDNTGNSGRTDAFSDSSGDSVNVNENGNYVIGTFVASNSEETITENGPFPNINLLQVRDLTPAAVVTNYQSSVLADDPVGYWPLDLTDANAANGIATDLSGNGNNGSYNNITPSGNLVAGPTLYLPNAASFNNADVFLGAGNNTNLLDFGGPITMEAWVQPANTSESLADVLAKGYDGNNNDDEITLRANSGSYSGGTYDGSDGGASAQGSQQTTNWTYLVATYDGANWNLYVNSQLVGQGADTVGAIEWLNYWAIGNGTASGNGRLFQGNICQVALYDYSLTPAQVLAHYYEAEINASPNTSVPILLTEPQPQGSYVGGSATFSVTAISALPMTNQWYKGGVLLPGQTNTTLTVSNLPQGSVNYTVRVGNANGSTNATASLTVRVPNDLEWSANGNDGIWNVTSDDWLNLSNSNQTNFYQGDQVLFDDTPSVPTSVTISGTVFPSLITVNSSANNFTFSSGTIAGSGSLLKEGTSVLNIMSAGTISGTATIGGGALYASNSLDSVSAITVSNGATLDFGGGVFSGSPKPITVSGTGLNGEGALYNSYGNPGQVVNITLAGNTLFAGSARWDLDSGSEISGPYNLALDWSGGAGYSQWNSITIGANVPQITLTNSGTLGMTGMDNSCQNTATILNIGTNDQLVCYSGGFNGGVSLYNGAQMTIYNGNLNLAGNNMHLYPGSTMYLYSSGIAMTGTNLTFETGSSLQTYYNGGNNPINNQVTLNGVAHWVLGDHAESFSNVVSGVGGFVLDYYNHEVVFSSSNTYSGPTVIGSDGNSPEVALAGNGSISHSLLIFFGGSDPTVAHIDASGRSDQTLTLTSGQTLAGVGGINGSLVVSPGATLSPSGTNTVIGITSTSTNAVGAIAASANVTLGGTTVIKLDGSGTNDMVEAAAHITYGGTLNLENISGSPPTASQSFQIFNAATYSGSFSGITPATPGAGLAWNTSQLSSGVISVVNSQPVISGTEVSGANLVFTVTGGNSGDTLYVLTRTNLLKGSWVTNATYQYGASGSLNVTNAINKGTPAQFFMIQGQ